MDRKIYIPLELPPTMNKQILKANCRYCNKEVFSLYKNQFEHNLNMHELNCPARDKKKEVKV